MDGDNVDGYMDDCHTCSQTLLYWFIAYLNYLKLMHIYMHKKEGYYH